MEWVYSYNPGACTGQNTYQFELRYMKRSPNKQQYNEKIILRQNIVILV